MFGHPNVSALHAEVYALAKRASDHAIPRMRAYHEIWYGTERVAGSEPEEPFYGRTYLPRKFKIGFVIPPSNDIDVYTQDLGFIAVAGSEGLAGFNVAIGGGMGRTDQAPADLPATCRRDRLRAEPTRCSPSATPWFRCSATSVTGPTARMPASNIRSTTRG